MGEAARSLHEDFQIEERAALRAVIHANVDLYSEHNFWTGLTMNMSEGGVFVATYHALPVGSMLLLQLRLPFEEHAMMMLVQVRWTRGYSAQDDVPPGLGLQFIDADACSLAKIRSFVATMREPLFFDTDD